LRETIWASGATAGPATATTRSMAWSDAITNCDNLVYAGYSDWRLPNVNELFSIFNYQYNNPSIGWPTQTLPWTNFNYAYNYFSSTTNSSVTTVAYYLNFSVSTISNSAATLKTQPLYIRPVRGGN